MVDLERTNTFQRVLNVPWGNKLQFFFTFQINDVIQLEQIGGMNVHEPKSMSCKRGARMKIATNVTIPVIIETHSNARSRTRAAKPHFVKNNT